MKKKRIEENGPSKLGVNEGRGAGGNRGVPEWEERGYTPVVFVRVANKGLIVYGTWKSVWKTEGMWEAKSRSLTPQKSRGFGKTHRENGLGGRTGLSTMKSRIHDSR